MSVFERKSHLVFLFGAWRFACGLRRDAFGGIVRKNQKKDVLLYFIILRRMHGKFRLWFFLVAIVIVTVSFVFTYRLVNRLAHEEQQKIEIWAQATQLLISTQATDATFDFIWHIIENNENIPVIIADSSNRFIAARNLGKASDERSDAFYARKIARFKTKHTPIVIEMPGGERQYLYYDDSISLKRLTFFPYVLWMVVGLFLAISFWAFATDMRSEQNRVWVGLSKETAHQLGTPVSSLMAWVEILKTHYAADATIAEMGKDVDRLRTIADRFSKVGSQPVLEPYAVIDVVTQAVDYMRRRTSKQVVYCIHAPSESLKAFINPPLFEWVLENLCKNAVDAMEGVGTLSVVMGALGGNRIFIDITDTGKGIERRNFRNVFKPGFTTKQRGWGLGLSLAKRIVETYHRGRISIKSSEVGQGTVFRIVLRRA